MTRTLRSTLTALALTALAFTAACGDDKGGEPPDLDGKWALDSSSLDSSISGKVNNENRPWMQFEGSTVNGFAGCNTFNTTVTYDAEKMSFAPLAMTMMACDDTANQIEAAFVAALDTVEYFEFEGQSLRLQNGDSLVVLTMGSVKE